MQIWIQPWINQWMVGYHWDTHLIYLYVYIYIRIFVKHQSMSRSHSRAYRLTPSNMKFGSWYACMCMVHANSTSKRTHIFWVPCVILSRSQRHFDNVFGGPWATCGQLLNLLWGNNVEKALTRYLVSAKKLLSHCCVVTPICQSYTSDIISSSE